MIHNIATSNPPIYGRAISDSKHVAECAKANWDAPAVIRLAAALCALPIVSSENSAQILTLRVFSVHGTFEQFSSTNQTLILLHCLVLALPYVRYSMRFPVAHPTRTCSIADWTNSTAKRTSAENEQHWTFHCPARLKENVLRGIFPRSTRDRGSTRKV